MKKTDAPSDGAALGMIVLFGAIGALVGFGSHGDAQHAALGAGTGAIVASVLLVLAAIG